MSNSSQVAVVGRNDAVAPLRAVGLAVFGAECGPDAVARVEEILAAGHQVVFYSEELTQDLAPLVQRYSGRPLPCLIALPGTGAAGPGRLRDIVKRAVGADIFGTDTERRQA